MGACCYSSDHQVSDAAIKNALAASEAAQIQKGVVTDPAVVFRSCLSKVFGQDVKDLQLFIWDEMHKNEPKDKLRDATVMAVHEVLSSDLQVAATQQTATI